MNPESFDCNCGHRLALHTYYKDLTPCTLCRCATFSSESLASEAPSKRRRPRRSGSYAKASDARAEAERRPV